MSTTTTNEAAERLRAPSSTTSAANDLRWYLRESDEEYLLTLLDEALAAERRATVARIRAAAIAKRKSWGAEGLPASLEQILDEEAAL